jgi:glycosyltransferase involved in cell wall biosynthesis
MKLSIVIPVYNEKNTIKELVQRVLKVDVGLIKEIIIVDDGSDDGTQEILKSINRSHIKIIYHNTNQGKGTALRTGFNETEGDIILVQDTDLEYDPKEYPRLLDPILDGRADAVYGSRFLGGPHRVLYYWHYVGNRFLTAFSNMPSNLNLSDMETCYKVPISYSGRDYSEGKKVGWKDGLLAYYYIIRFKFFN